MATSWPPMSPKAALLSSPSGRRKLEKSHEHRNTYTSPLKRGVTTPDLQRKPPHLFDMDEDIGRGDVEEDEDEDEDEETLRLKLAAITAKLKLKKIQQNKARLQAEPLEAMASGDRHQADLSNATLVKRLHRKDGQDSVRQSRKSDVEVLVSPTKKNIQFIEQRSPSRILLGIDKGIKGDDISLRRARRTSDGTSQRAASRFDRLSSRRSAFSSVRTTTSSTIATGEQFKSFSEKMAESRSVQKAKDSQRETILKSRTSGFKLDKTEMESLRLAVEEAPSRSPPRSEESREQVEVCRSDILHSHGEQNVTSSQLKCSQTSLTLRNLSRKLASSGDDGGSTTEKNRLSGDTSLFEAFSQSHLSTRILPHTFLQRTLSDGSYTLLRLPDLLKSIHAPLFELPDSIVDYVVFGIIASKSSPQDHKSGTGNAKSSNDWEKKWDDGSQNQKKFMVFQLTDLTWSVDLFLFGTALPRYHRLSLGTVVAILNPGIMPPRKGKEDTGAFSLTLHSGDDTILEIGTARDLGFCKAVKKDGKECGSWVNSAKTEYCEWHLNAQVSKAQAGRMGVNTGSNAAGLVGRSGTELRSRFSSGRIPGHRQEVKERQGLLPRKGGQQFDTHTGSHYFIASSGGGSHSEMAKTPAYRSDRIAANLLQVDDDDPFIAEGQLSRDKESRLRKRLIAEEKERSIAQNLAQMNSGGTGGDYIRQQLGAADSSTKEQGSQRSALAMRVGIINSDPAGKGTGKRSAETVRLSPIKKTRLLTEKGIRHPGRESFGVQKGKGNTDDDDDDLDII